MENTVSPTGAKAKLAEIDRKFDELDEKVNEVSKSQDETIKILNYG